MSSSTQPPSQQISLSTLHYITATDLHTRLTSPSTSSKLSIIDVRDSDHIGGHIRTSTHIPINQLDAHMPELLRVNADKERVVFHCMLSQQRGPKAALAYARARVEKVRKEKREDGKGEEVRVVDGEGRIGGQEVCVLVGGFEGWRGAGYADDEGVTEGYVRELWE